MSTEPTLKLWVPADGNVVVEERLMRSLRSHLAEVDGADVRIAADPAPVPEGAKGSSAAGDAAVWVFLSAATHGSARVLVEAIRAWSANQRNRAVHARTANGAEWHVPPETTETQQRLIETVVESERS